MCIYHWSLELNRYWWINWETFIYRIIQTNIFLLNLDESQVVSKHFGKIMRRMYRGANIKDVQERAIRKMKVGDTLWLVYKTCHIKMTHQAWLINL